MLKKYISLLFIIVFAIVTFLAGWFSRGSNSEKLTLRNPLKPTPIPRPLEKYEIEKLSQINFSDGSFIKTSTLEEEDTYTSYVFEFTFEPALDGEKKKTSGMLTIPTPENDNYNPEGYPLIVMFRGYVDQTIYETGIGTHNAARFFAENGFITIAPDFLGYADSDINASDIFESRFQTYTTALSLIESFDSSSYEKLTDDNWNKKDIFIWAHSNGGQIALTTLEVGEYNFPTTLWAPVTEGFPYSVLFYTNESIDKGKYIRSELAAFESLYDAEKFSIDEYQERIIAPLVVHQGTTDDAIPLEWTDNFINELESLGKDITYYKYQGADHNMRPDWDTVIQRDVEFFKSHLD